MKFTITSFVLLVSLLHYVVPHKEGKPPRDVECNYIEDDRGYVCEIVSLKLYHEDDNLRFKGNQLRTKTNEDVNYLHIHSSETHIVPSENIFSYFTNLAMLKMKGVHVKKIDPIRYCTPLELINLSGNEIQSIAAGVFIECENLEILDLSQNEIKKIDENGFSSLKVLEELYLSENRLVKITRKTLSPLKKLKKLSLRANKLTETPQNVFNDLFDLTELDLSENSLTRLDFRVFDFTIHIETLLLRNIGIKKFHQYTFTNLRRLRVLDVSHNDLKFIENEMLATNKAIRELRMDACGIEAIGRQFFDKLDQLELIHVNQNKCVDGVFRGDVVDIRPKFLKCFENWDRRKEKGDLNTHSGDEL